MADTSGDPCAIRKSTRCSCARLMAPINQSRAFTNITGGGLEFEGDKPRQRVAGKLPISLRDAQAAAKGWIGTISPYRSGQRHEAE